VASRLGYKDSEVLLPRSGEVLEFRDGKWSVVETITLKSRMVDGLGVGDVGRTVLADRKVLGEDGMIVVVIPRDKDGYNLRKMHVESRGFVFMKEAQDVVKFIKDTTAEIISSAGNKLSEDDISRKIEKKLARKLNKIIKRTPMILPIFIGE
jgi:ribonuclease J